MKTTRIRFNDLRFFQTQGDSISLKGTTHIDPVGRIIIHNWEFDLRGGAEGEVLAIKNGKVKTININEIVLNGGFTTASAIYDGTNLDLSIANLLYYNIGDPRNITGFVNWRAGNHYLRVQAGITDAVIISPSLNVKVFGEDRPGEDRVIHILCANPNTGEIYVYYPVYDKWEENFSELVVDSPVEARGSLKGFRRKLSSSVSATVPSIDPSWLYGELLLTNTSLTSISFTLPYRVQPLASNIVTVPAESSKMVFYRKGNDDFLLYTWGSGGGGGGSSALISDIVVTGLDFGALPDGTVVPAGTEMEDMLRQAATKVLAPNYSSPTATLNSSINTGTFEVGSTMSPAFTINYNQNDGGASTSADFLKNTVSQSVDTTQPYNYSTSFNLVEGNTVFGGRVAYQEGPVKNNNLGQPSPGGRILAGTATTNSISYVGKRMTFWGFTNPATSTDVRLFAGKQLGSAKGSVFTINIPVGAAEVTYLYPKTLGLTAKVEYVEGLNADIKDIFTVSEISVQSANGFDAVVYYKFNYRPAGPFTQTATYKVTV